jgi:Holliday junction DNA helicase RuvB
MSGPPGLGKTSLARIVANEMQSRVIEIVGSMIKGPADVAKHLLEVKPFDIVFIDEIHAVPRKAEEALYGAIEDRTISVGDRQFDDLTKQLGIKTRDSSRVIHRLPPFCLVGATTLLGLVTAPLRSRFGQVLELEPYTIAELCVIVTNAAARMAFDVPALIAEQIAARSRGTARTAICNLQWFRDFVTADGGISTQEALDAAFDLKGIDRNGLTKTDREYLALVAESTDPIGLESLATGLSESSETVETAIEPFLLRQGYVQKTSRGRIATAKARELFAKGTQ